MSDILSKYDINLSNLCSGLFSDVMDRMGYKHQIITGFRSNQKITLFIGRARTVCIETKETNDENIRMGLSFIGKLGEEDILVVKGSDRFAYFGELMTRLSTRQGINGVVIGGLTRDTNYTFRDDVKLPILAKGFSPVDIKGRGRVSETDKKIDIDAIEVNPGNIIFADNEAVCVIPREIEEEVMRKVKEKIADEERITSLIVNGMGVDELLENVTEF